MRKTLFTIVILLIWTSVAFAHGSRFFEFAPDVSDELKIIDVDTPSQPFTALNDTLDGFDLWLANKGAAGEASFEIRNDVNSLLASGNFNIPNVSEKYGGTRFHVNLPQKISVISGKIYKLRIISTTPDFKLYKASQFQILQHNTQGNPDYNVELAQIGSVEQDFAFKYALYEDQESTPPSISNVSVTVLSPTSVKIEFNSNEPVDFRADFNPVAGGNPSATQFSGNYVLCPTAAKKCSLTAGVLAGVSYNFTLLVKDEWGNQNQSSGSFETPANGSPPPPPAGGSPPPPPPTPPPPPVGVSPPPPPTLPSMPPPTLPLPSPPAVLPPPPAPPTGGGLTPPPPTPTPPTSAPPPASFPPPPSSSGTIGGGSFTNPSDTITVTVAKKTFEKSKTGETSITVEWRLPPGKKAKGFVVKIFDQAKNETKEISVSQETRKMVIEKLGAGRYRITVFMDIDGKLEALGEPVEIEILLKESINPFTTFRIALAGAIALAASAAVILTLRFFRKKRIKKTF